MKSARTSSGRFDHRGFAGAFAACAALAVLAPPAGASSPRAIAAAALGPLVQQQAAPQPASAAAPLGPSAQQQATPQAQQPRSADAAGPARMPQPPSADAAGSARMPQPRSADAPGPARMQQPDANTLLAQALELHQAGDYLGAIAAYESALKLQPDNAGAHSNLGAALVHLGRYDEGIAHYRRALEIDPTNVMFRFNLALALYKNGDAPGAAPELQKVLAAQDQRNARVLLGDCYLRMGRFQDVVDLLSPYERELGDDRAFSYVLGSAYVETNRPNDAQRVIDRIFRGGESAEGHLLMATAYLRQADGPSAVAELKKALALNPQLPVANALLGRALLRSGDQEGALRAFRRELELNPNDFDANLEVGELKKRDQQFDDALVYIQRARRMRPNDASAGFSLAGVYVSTGKPEDARVILEQVLKDQPKYSEAAVLLATVYYRLNRKADGDRMRAVVEQLNAEAQARNQKVKD